MSQFSLDKFKPSNLFDLTGRVAIVTGGATGIGLCQSRGIAAAGAKVYILARREDVTKDIVQKYGFAGALIGDVTNKDSIEAAVKDFSSKEDRLDILVSNAGGAGPMLEHGVDTSGPEGNYDPAKKHKPISPEEYKKQIWETQTFENWEEIFRVNSHALLFVAVAFLPLLAKGSEHGQKQQRPYTSTVISTSSISAFVSQSQLHYAYNAAKASVVRLTETMAYEFTHSVDAKVRVNSVAPGVFPSQMTGGGRDPKTGKSDLSEVLPVMAIPVPRPGRAEEMAAAITYLSACEYSHGTILTVDGGFSLSEP